MLVKFFPLSQEAFFRPRQVYTIFRAQATSQFYFMYLFLIYFKVIAFLFKFHALVVRGEAIVMYCFDMRLCRQFTEHINCAKYLMQISCLKKISIPIFCFRKIYTRVNSCTSVLTSLLVKNIFLIQARLGYSEKIEVFCMDRATRKGFEYVFFYRFFYYIQK